MAFSLLPARSNTDLLIHNNPIKIGHGINFVIGNLANRWLDDPPNQYSEQRCDEILKMTQSFAFGI